MEIVNVINKQQPCFSVEQLYHYQDACGLSRADLACLRSRGVASQLLLEQICGAPPSEDLLQLIRQFGYPLGALRWKGLEWELVCLIDGRNDVTEILIDFVKQPGVTEILLPAEQLLLSMYARSTTAFLGRQVKHSASFYLPA